MQLAASLPEPWEGQGGIRIRDECPPPTVRMSREARLHIGEVHAIKHA
jgi:hypothetical protein